ALAAIDQRIGESVLVPRVPPDQPVHQYAGVQPDHVVSLVDNRAPPGPLYVVLELGAERAIVPHRSQAAVDIAGWKDEAPAFCERCDCFDLRHDPRWKPRLADRERGAN